jgi:hypothetical protein
LPAEQLGEICFTELTRSVGPLLALDAEADGVVLDPVELEALVSIVPCTSTWLFAYFLRSPS